MYYQQQFGRPTSVVVAAVLAIGLAVLEVPSVFFQLISGTPKDMPGSLVAFAVAGEFIGGILLTVGSVLLLSGVTRGWYVAAVVVQFLVSVPYFMTKVSFGVAAVLFLAGIPVIGLIATTGPKVTSYIQAKRPR